jgi:hypothetical protein
MVLTTKGFNVYCLNVLVQLLLLLLWWCCQTTTYRFTHTATALLLHDRRLRTELWRLYTLEK